MFGGHYRSGGGMMWPIVLIVGSLSTETKNYVKRRWKWYGRLTGATEEGEK